MRDIPQDVKLSDLKDDWRLKRDALGQIAGACEAINYPPDLITEILSDARNALVLDDDASEPDELRH